MQSLCKNGGDRQQVCGRHDGLSRPDGLRGVLAAFPPLFGDETLDGLLDVAMSLGEVGAVRRTVGEAHLHELLE